MSTVQSIPTLYDGIKFRSRTEARWAVFLDVLNVKYDYETEGFDLGDGLFYLPDFWLPKQRIYVEIKPEEPTNEETEKALRLATHTRRCVLIQKGMPRLPDFGSHDTEAICVYPDNSEDRPFFWTQCESCRTFNITFEGRTERLKCQCEDRGPRYNFDAPQLIIAYERAKSREFWNPKE